MCDNENCWLGKDECTCLCEGCGLPHLECVCDYVEDKKKERRSEMLLSLWFAETGEVIKDFVIIEGNAKITMEVSELLKQFNLTIEEIKEKLKKVEQVSLYYEDGTEVILKKEEF